MILETFRLRDREDFLNFEWTGLRTPETQWDKLIEIFGLFQRESMRLGRLQGTISVTLLAADDPLDSDVDLEREVQMWPLELNTGDSPAIEISMVLDKIAMASHSYRPRANLLNITMRPEIFLAEDVTALELRLQTSSPDWPSCPFTLERLENETAPAGYRAYRLMDYPMTGPDSSPLVLEFYLGAFGPSDDEANSIGLRVVAEVDLWLRDKFLGDGMVVAPATTELNATLMRKTLASIAEETGGAEDHW